MQTDSLGVQDFLCRSIRGACHKTIMSQRVDTLKHTIGEAVLKAYHVTLKSEASGPPDLNVVISTYTIN